MRMLRFFTLVLALMTSPFLCQSAEKTAPAPYSGVDFDRAVEAPIKVLRSARPVREALQRISAETRVSYWLDRRLDPNRLVSLDVTGVRVREAFRELARNTGAEAGVVNALIYIGPPPAVRALKAQIDRRRLELEDVEDKLVTRRKQLLNKHALAWQDFDRPIDLLKSIGTQASLKLEGLDQIPHDRWAGGRTGELNAIEALSVVLIQFDLTFEWTADLKGIQILPLPKRELTEQAHSLVKLTPEAAQERVQKEFPDLKVVADTNELTITATAEEHRVIDRLLTNQTVVANPPGPAAAPKSIALHKRLFTVKLVREPASALLQQLRNQDVNIEYDESVLKEAQIDLEKKISLDVKKATVDKFFTEICKPLGLSFEIKVEKDEDGKKVETVHLFPKP